MANNYKILEEISDEQDIYYVSILMLSLATGRSIYSDVAELALLLDKESFKNLIGYYGGSTVRIPTSDEVISSMEAALLYYYTEVLNYSMEDALKKTGIEKTNKRISHRILRIKELINNFSIPKELKHPEEILQDE